MIADALPHLLWIVGLLLGLWMILYDLRSRRIAGAEAEALGERITATEAKCLAATREAASAYELASGIVAKIVLLEQRASSLESSKLVQSGRKAL